MLSNMSCFKSRVQLTEIRHMIQLILVVDYDYLGVWIEVLMAKQVSKNIYQACGRIENW